MKRGSLVWPVVVQAYNGSTEEAEAGWHTHVTGRWPGGGSICGALA